MSDPVLIGTYGNAFIYYTCDRDPTTSEPFTYNNYSDLLMVWWNTSTNNLFWCLDDTESSMIWVNSILSNNILSILNSLGWGINTNRNYVNRLSPSFNTSYIPSSTNDTFVTVTVNIVLSLLQSSTIDIQVDTGSGFVTIATAAPGGVAINDTRTLIFIVPSGATYKIVSSGTGTNTLNSIYEISM